VLRQAKCVISSTSIDKAGADYTLQIFDSEQSRVQDEHESRQRELTKRRCHTTLAHASAPPSTQVATLILSDTRIIK
jgi:hypothetical protein